MLLVTMGLLASLCGGEPEYRLTRDWGGARDRMEDAGVTLQLVYILDVAENTTGGISQGVEVLGHVDLTLQFDLDSLIGWTGGSVRLRGSGMHGGDPTLDRVGDAQIQNNIEAPNTANLYEGWFQQRVYNASARLGFIAIDTEFNIVPDAALFVHSAPGTTSVFGNSGANGPSIYPVTSLGARLDVQPRDNLTLRTAFLDAEPGDPDNPRRFDPSIDPDDGWLVVGEAAWDTLDAPACFERRKVVGGFYAFTARRQDPTSQDNTVPGPVGGYLLAQQQIYCESDDADAGGQGVSVFVQGDAADGRVTLFDAFVGGGTVWRGALPSRDADELGLALAAARFGRGYRAIRRGAGLDTELWEVALELTYRVEVLPGFIVQPDLQFIINPRGEPLLDDAWVLTGRLFLTL